MFLKFSLFCLSLLLFSSLTNAFNITKMLSEHSNFSNFNDFLKQTHVAGTINGRQTITVLAVSNSGASALSGKSTDLIKKVVSLHVILDYYDVKKLQNLSKKTALVTTLFQSSGDATGKLGFLNVTVNGDTVLFRSPGSGSTANLVSSVTAQPYNISILEVSSFIVPENTAGGQSPKKAPSPSSEADSPAPSSEDEKNSPAPEADSPAPSGKPEAGSQVDSPPMPAEADEPSADGPAGADSSAKNEGFGYIFSGFMMIFSSIWILG